MRRTPLPRECPYFTPLDRKSGERTVCGDWKKIRRAEVRQLGVRPRFVDVPDAGSRGDGLILFGRSAESALLKRAPAPPRRAPGVAASPVDQLPDKPKLSEPKCVTTFDANTKVTKMQASAKIDVPVTSLVAAIDPRGWGLSNGIIDVAFRVSRGTDGVYRPLEDDLKVPLGTPWSNDLLFEYAKSEIASFENILMIDTFRVTPEELCVEYHLVDCLKTIIGFWGVDGGLQRNDGFVRVRVDDSDDRNRRKGRAGRDRPRGSIIEVEKNIRVRDMTPNDPGNRYDFGQSINSTLGAALSLWVDDVSMMSPVF